MSRNRTQYVVTLNGTEVASRTEKPAAIKLAQVLVENDTTVTAQVTAEPSGKVVFEYTAPKGETKSERAKPFTRTIPADTNVPAPEGYVAAYNRRRTGAVVFRALPDADVSSPYLVAAYGTLTPAANTVEARAITNGLEAARLAAKRAE